METVALKLSQAQELIAVARAFCRQINQLSENRFDWLSDVNRLLPRIHASIAELGRLSEDLSHTIESDVDDRFDLFSKIKAFLGEHDSYSLEFDAEDEHFGQSGSLADDFTDIYFELKNGLDLYDRDPGRINEALNNWRAGFYLQWGQHLVDAERQLYAMCSKRRIWKHQQNQAE